MGFREERVTETKDGATNGLEAFIEALRTGNFEYSVEDETTEDELYGVEDDVYDLNDMTTIDKFRAIIDETLNDVLLGNLRLDTAGELRILLECYVALERIK